MRFGGHIVYLWPEKHHLLLNGARVQIIAMRDRNKLYARQKSFDYYYQYTRPNCTNSFNNKKVKLNRDVA